METYTCECCGKSFEKGWSDKEARRESEKNFPGLEDEDAAVVCDDCYKKIMDKSPKQIAKSLVSDNFPIENYELLQEERKIRLKFWESWKIYTLVKNEKELIKFGEEVLREMRKLL
jgi:DNA-directed RNA polymerase subunit RPC12/RpoP